MYMFKLVHNEAQTVGMRIVGIQLKCLPVCFFLNMMYPPGTLLVPLSVSGSSIYQFLAFWFPFSYLVEFVELKAEKQNVKTTR